ncbi:MAG: DUF5702 domain-containing protein [Eubacteriales bacterium]
MKTSNQEGVITIFLSLIILMMLCIIATTVETTRIRIAKAQVERSLNTAMNSVLAEYDSELMDEYGIMTLDGSYGTNTLNTANMEEKLEYYLQRSLQPSKDLDDGNFIYQLFLKDNDNFIDLNRYNIKSVGVNSLENITDKTEAEVFKNQIVEYMKYRGLWLLAEEFLDKLDLVSKSAKTAEVIQKKAEVEEKAEDVGEDLLSLMTEIDGVKFDKDNKVEIKDGKVIIRDTFAKKFIFSGSEYKSKPTNHNAFSNEIERKMINVPKKVISVNSSLQDLFDNSVEYYKLEKELEKLEDEKSDLEEDEKILEEKITATNEEINMYEGILESKESSDTEIMGAHNAIEGFKKNISGDEEELEVKRKEISNVKKEIQKCESEIENILMIISENTYQEDMAYLVSELDKIKTVNEDALDNLEDIQDSIDEVKKSIDEFDNELDTNQEEMVGNTYNSMKNDLTNLKSEIGIQDNGDVNLDYFGNLIAIKETLSSNCDFLTSDLVKEIEEYSNEDFMKNLDESAKEMVDKENNDNSVSPVDEWIEEITNYFDELESKYSINSLYFDYSEFNIQKQELLEEQTDPRENNEIKNTETMIDNAAPEEVKDLGKEFENAEILPTQKLKNKKKEISIEKASFKDNLGFIDKALDYLVDIGASIVKEVKDLPKELLINEYIMGNFRSSVDHLDGGEELTLSNYKLEDHYLDYEVEYILEGHFNEQNNLKIVSNRIMFIRFAMNLIHIIADPEKRTEAFSLAMLCIGWTPLPFLVYIVQFLIMCAWSYGESFIDLKMLLDGERVAFIKTKEDWVLSINGITQFALDSATKEANKKVNEGINKAVTKANEFIDDLGEGIGEDLKVYANKQITTVFDEAYRLKDEASDYIDQQVDAALDEVINAVSKDIKNPNIDLEIIYNNNGNDLIDEIIQKVNNKRNELLDGTVNEMINIKKEIFDSIEGKISQAKNIVSQKVDSAIDNGIGEVKKELKDTIGSTGNKIGTIATDTIDEYSKKLKDKIDTNVKSSVSETIKTGDSKDESFLGKYNITFSYEDYLRLFLLFVVNDTSKLYRTMDCIQMNKGIERGEDFSLENQIFAFNATVQVEMDYIFFDLGFMPDEAKDLGKTKHIINAKISNSY